MKHILGISVQPDSAITLLAAASFRLRSRSSVFTQSITQLTRSPWLMRPVEDVSTNGKFSRMILGKIRASVHPPVQAHAGLSARSYGPTVDEFFTLYSFIEGDPWQCFGQNERQARSSFRRQTSVGAAAPGRWSSRWTIAS